jgi:hypothetical protein
MPAMLEATLNKWRSGHDRCLRADRGALAQMDWPSFKAVEQGAARRQGSPDRLECIEKGGVQKADRPRREPCQGLQPSLRLATRLAELQNAMMVVPFVQRWLDP